MLKIAYPHHDFKIKQSGDKDFIFDENRRKWVRLTPEEWVRQNFLQYLMQVKKFPTSLIAVEKEIILNTLKKRCDIIVYKNDKPWMIVECKEPVVNLDDKVLQQILRYNMALPVQFLVITNGNSTALWERKDNIANALEEIPFWDTE